MLSLAALALSLAMASSSAAQAQTPLPLKPDQPVTTTNHRLILKDGSYQVVRKYEIVGDRVRYISVERGGDWEELPVELVDWEATHMWERDHASQPVEETSPAMKEAEEIDKEEADERDEQKARRPEVAQGLELPDEDGVFALDTYEGKPELVELLPADLAMDAKSRHGLSTLNPLAVKASLELEGAHAKIHLHVNAPAIYLALASSDEAETVPPASLRDQATTQQPTAPTQPTGPWTMLQGARLSQICRFRLAQVAAGDTDAMQYSTIPRCGPTRPPTP